MKAAKPLVTSLLLLSLLSLGLLSGCASSSIFNPYPQQAANYQAAIARGEISNITTNLSNKTSGKDKLLYLSERGRLHQLNGQFEKSKHDFAKAIQIYQQMDHQANVSATDLGSKAVALFSNDNAIPYNGAGYERLFIHQFQVFNFLALGDLEAANVEVRRAALEQRQLELSNEKAITKSQQEAKNKHINTDVWRNTPELASMDLRAGKIKSAFQNAYIFYLSAVLWEAQGNINDALVDYKKALEINPSNTYIAQDIQRLIDNKKTNKNGTLIILFEDGFIPSRQSLNISVPYASGSDGGYLTHFASIAVPYYSNTQALHTSALKLYHNHHKLGQTENIADITGMAIKTLKDDMLSIIIRLILRLRTKYELQQQATEKAGILGSLVSSIYNLASQGADLRSWLTLPSNAQIMRTELPLGQQMIEFELKGTSLTKTINIRPGKITIMRVINANNRIITQLFEL